MRGTTQSEQIARIKNTVYSDTAQSDINHLLRIIQAEKMSRTANRERHIITGIVTGAIIMTIIFKVMLALYT